MTNWLKLQTWAAQQGLGLGSWALTQACHFLLEEAYPQCPTGAAPALNTLTTIEEVEDDLARRLHNRRAKSFQGRSSEFLRYAKHAFKREEALPEHVHLPAIQ